MKHMLHAVNDQRPRLAGDVGDAFDPQQTVAVADDQTLDPRDEGVPVERLVASKADGADAGIVPNHRAVIVCVHAMVVRVMIVVVAGRLVVSVMIVIVTRSLVRQDRLVAQPALDVDTLGRGIVETGVEQLGGVDPAVQACAG